MNDLVATLSPEEWDYVFKCLMGRPYGEVALLIEKLKSQLAKPPASKTNEKAP